MPDPASNPEQLDSDAKSSPADEAHVDFDVYCHECGYNIRGIESSRCPECGKNLPATQKAEPSIPWIHRKRIGNVSAFFKTVLFATFSPRKLSKDVYLHIDFRKAQKFRHWTIGVAMLWMVVLTILLHVASHYGHVNDRTIVELLEMYWPSAVFNVLALLYLILATGVPGVFFDYRDIPVNLRNNAIALSYYCTAPLTWGPVFVVAPLAVWYDSVNSYRVITHNMEITIMFAGILIPLIPAVPWAYSLARIAERITHNHQRRVAWMFIGMPVMLALLAVAIFGLIPLASFYVWVLIDTLS
ncbi:MAG: hypothetical protein DHS20C16_08790 [Phycisphaerae bacterium]|nr:MAG: hypothetical protein DHS20C16_08790 [Phycisphaerae bacterium]